MKKNNQPYMSNVFEFFFQKGSNNLVLLEILPIFAP